MGGNRRRGSTPDIGDRLTACVWRIRAQIMGRGVTDRTDLAELGVHTSRAIGPDTHLRNFREFPDFGRVRKTDKISQLARVRGRDLWRRKYRS